MELPKELADIYKHWRYHTIQAATSVSQKEVFKDAALYKNIVWFIHERNSIWRKKYVGDAPPYTSDSILSTYRFCNVFREFDKQTIQFHTLLQPLEKDFSLWLLNMFYCRMVARPETVTDVGLLSFDAKENKEVYKRLLDHPKPKYGTPYVFPISVIMKSKTPTRELFLTVYLPQVIQAVAKEIESWDKASVYDGVEKVLPLFGYNLRFLWTEVLIDVAYQYPQYIDLFKRFPVGPGSLPTLQRIDADTDPSTLVEQLASLNIHTDVTYKGKPILLSAENWEGIGCEFRKYCNLKEGRGRKRLYK